MAASRRAADRDPDLSDLLADPDPERLVADLGARLLAALPAHCVSLDRYAISRVSVTNAEYRRFVDQTGAATPEAWSLPEAAAPQLPVRGVSWREADAFARWAGAALPSEAQWERAARGATRRPFPWGEDFGERGDWILTRDRAVAWPAREHPELASPEGVLDLVTYAWEWCADELDEPQAIARELAALFGPREARGRVVRGGEGLGCAIPSAVSRSARDPGWRSMLAPVGFRLVRLV